ncbi:MAG: hypothetical protein QXW97_01540 [Candidatus Pacearchaeota archaeon]
MHEHHFIQNIINQVPNKDKVISIDIELGELVGIDSHHLKEHLFDETSWNVSVFLKKSKVKCNCGYIGEPRIIQRLHDFVIFDCPLCGGEPLVLEGNEIKILRVTYDK